MLGNQFLRMMVVHRSHFDEASNHKMKKKFFMSNIHSPTRVGDAVERDEFKISPEIEIEDSPLRDVFVHLSEGRGKISLEEFKAWEVIAHFKASGYLTEFQINSIVSDIIATENKQLLDYDQFISLVHHIDAVATAAHPNDPNGHERVREVKESLLREFFEQLREECARVSRDKILEWDIVLNLISSSNPITEAYVDSLLEDISPGEHDGEASSLALAQFVEFAHRLDVAIRHHDIRDKEFVAEEASMVEDSLLQSVFDQLSKGAKTLSVRDIKDWDAIRHLTQSEMIAMETVSAFIHDLLVRHDEAVQSIEDAELTYAQFQELAHKIDGTTQHISGRSMVDESEGEIEGGVEEVLLRNVFKHLCGDGQTTASVNSIKEWDVISHLIFSGSLTAREVDAFIEELHLVENGGLSYTQFVWLAHRIDKATHRIVGEDVDSMGIEQVSHSLDEESANVSAQLLEELFSQLSRGSQTVSIESLRSWSVIPSMIESGLISGDNIHTIIREVLGDNVVEFDYESFVNLMHRIDECTAAGIVSYSQDEVHSSDSSGRLEENLRSAFDQLRSVSNIPTTTAITLKALREWDVINHLIAIGSLQYDDLERILNGMFRGGAGMDRVDDGVVEVDFDQFVEFAHQINNATVASC